MIEYDVYVKCIVCGEMHEAKSLDYFCLNGNISFGLGRYGAHQGGLQGAALSGEYRVKRGCIYCTHCLIQNLKEDIERSKKNSTDIVDENEGQ